MAGLFVFFRRIRTSDGHENSGVPQTLTSYIVFYNFRQCVYVLYDVTNFSVNFN